MDPYSTVDILLIATTLDKGRVAPVDTSPLITLASALTPERSLVMVWGRPLKDTRNGLPLATLKNHPTQGKLTCMSEPVYDGSRPS